MLQYDHNGCMIRCPRCYSVWPRNKTAPPPDTCECGFRIVIVDRLYASRIMHSVPILYWDLDDKQCRLYPNGFWAGLAETIVIYLPLLPFDVSMEEIQKYLVLA